MENVGDQGGGVAGFMKGFGQGDVFEEQGVPAGHLHRIMLLVVVEGHDSSSGHQVSPNGNRRQGLRVGIFEDEAVLGKAVEVGAVHLLSPVAGQVVGTKGVHVQQDEVQPVSLVFLIRRFFPDSPGSIGSIPLGPAASAARQADGRRRGRGPGQKFSSREMFSRHGETPFPCREHTCFTLYQPPHYMGR